jgi:hypothetical protein
VGELGGSVTYLYWSERRVERILSDNGLQFPVRSTKVSSPSVYTLAPTVEYTSNGRTPQRSSIAELVERSLGQAVISNYDSDPGPRYAKGVGTLVFGEFINDFEDHRKDINRRALIFSSCDYGDSDKDSVAICLFGSMDNFADYVQSSGIPSESGWTSSAAPSVLDFLAGKWTDAVDEPSREEIAIEALKIADSQGMTGGMREPPLKGWRRSFTYGDIQSIAEWFAEIYLDVDLISSGMGRVDGFRRIVVGAPIWVRTPRLRAVRLYNEYTLAELEDEPVTPTHSSMVRPIRRKRASGMLGRFYRKGEAK